MNFDKLVSLGLHLFTYEAPGITSEWEAKRAIVDGKKLVSVISEKIREKNP
jgi:hypothetical protein